MAQTPTAPKFPYGIYITPECLTKLNLYAKHALPTEIGGLAKLEINNNHKNIYVVDVHMFPQEATGGTFEFSGAAMNEWTRMMIKQGRADELPYWRSIVHSHPVNMGTFMSGPDVDNIKLFADDEDAFSLIISASHKADSTRMSMHYCYNIKAESTSPFFEGDDGKRIVSDIPVGIAMSGERIAISEVVAKHLIAKFADKDLTDNDKIAIMEASEKMVTELLPDVFENEYSTMSKHIEEDVARIVKRAPMYSYGSGADRWKSQPKQKTSQAKDDNDALEEYYSQYARMADEGGGYSSLSEDEQEFLGYTSPIYSYTERRELKELYDNVLTCYAVGFLETDPDDPNKKVSTNRARKNRKRWEERVIELNKKLRPENNVGLWDRVVVDYEKMKTAPKDINQKLATQPHSVEDMTIGVEGMISFEVGGEMFWGYELKVIETFEEHQNRRRREMIEKHKAKSIENSAEATKELVILGPGDTTD